MAEKVARGAGPTRRMGGAGVSPAECHGLPGREATGKLPVAESGRLALEAQLGLPRRGIGV